MMIDKTVESNLSGGVSFKATENSAKLFSMLSEYLYANKELAVIHELSSNAIDAHKLVGKEDVPIEVHLPTTISPCLIIKDFGPGLSHDNVVRFLTTYGESDKGGSNDFIGGYGIGSKSPAAVTSTWSITSRHDGIARQYLIVVDAKGIPSLTKLREYESVETGLEVSIPINPSTSSEWLKSVKQAYTYYKVKPKIIGATVNYDDRKIVNDFNVFTLEKTSRYNSGVIALSGVRAYSVDESNILPHIDSHKQDLFNCIGSNVVIPFNIGEVEVDLSREKLRYSQFTIDALVKKFEIVFEQCKKHIIDSLDGKNRLEYLHIASGLYDIYGSFLFPVIQGNKYNIDCHSSLSYYTLDTSTVGLIKVGFNGKISTLTRRFSCGRTYVVTFNERSNIASIALSKYDRIKFILRDDKGIEHRVRNLSEKDDNIYIICDNFDAHPDLSDLVIKGSTLPTVVTVPKTRRPTLKTSVYLLHKNRFLKVDENDVKSNLNSVWVELDSSGTPIGVNGDFDDVSKLIRTFKNQHIFGVKTGKSKPIWFGRHVNDLVDEIKHDYTVQFNNYNHNSDVRNIILDSSYRFLVANRAYINSTKLDKIVEEISLLSVRLPETISSMPYGNRALLRELLNYTESVDKKSQTIETIKTLIEQIGSTYPMLKHVFDRGFSGLSSSDKNEIGDYIVMVEKSI